MIAGGAVVKNLPANERDAKDAAELGRSPGVGNGNPLQYSCLENCLDGGTWQATSPWGHKESDMSEHTCSFWKQ